MSYLAGVVVESIIFVSVFSFCPYGYFRVPLMTNCHPWLTCNDLSQIMVLEQIGQGVVKTVHRAKWQQINVTISFLNSMNLAQDFYHNLEMLKLYSHSPLVIQLVGFCEQENVLITEYHKLGSAANLASLLPEDDKNENSALRLCLNYALIIDLLHSGPNGPRVMCDSSDLSKLLSQLLITDNHTLILNDLDALPLVEMGQGIKCGHRELSGDFVAPEQRWQLAEPFNDERMQGYGVETDIWKLATVCETLLQYVPDSETSVYSLYTLHKRCKNPSPALRPTAREMVETYSKLLDESHDEL